MKLVFLSKLDQQAVKGMRDDDLVRMMILDHVSSPRRDFVLKVAICVDGRRNPRTDLDFDGNKIPDPADMTEAARLKDLVSSHVPGIAMEFVALSFVRPAADADDVAQSCHILINVGYRGDVTDIQRNLRGFQRIKRLSVPDIVRKRVQYGRLLWIGVCGGAMCAGCRFLDRRGPIWRGLNVLEGASIEYASGYNARDLGPSTTDHQKLVLTSFAGMSIWTRSPYRGQKGSCFVISKNRLTEKRDWCDGNHRRLCQALEHICAQWVYPTWPDGSIKGYAFRFDGWLFRDGKYKRIHSRNREDRHQPVLQS